MAAPNHRMMTRKQRFPRVVELGQGIPPVCRLGLATRGNTHLEAYDVRLAIDEGIGYLNWCTHEDGMSRAIAELSAAERERVAVAFQFYASTADEGEREFSSVLSTLKTDYIDVATFYYLESRSEWNRVIGPGGAMEFLQKVKKDGRLRLAGVTTHQRALGAEWTKTGLLDLLMIRYNAAHRGAERDVFPVTHELGIPVVVYTCTRWGALLRPTPDDPPGFRPPRAAEWYRFSLHHPDVAVALMAPNGAKELSENLSLLNDWQSSDETSLQALREHGDRVRKHGGSFP